MRLAGKQFAAWLRRKNFSQQAIGAFKAGLAATLCLWLGDILGLGHSYWAAISAIVVMGADNAVTFTSCRDRLIGTAVGALLGWITFYHWHGHLWFYGLAVGVCIFICSALQFDKAGRLAAVALTIVVLVHLDAGPGQAAISRFLEVGLGIVVALGVTLLVFPPKAVATVTTPSA
ncbi:aromatic acid exporter family protein [Acidipila sp. EB88]|uniref:FUSC family protein n=1 Tax=Acidipila sp. EB88 TaxID=2305226 RepID=UPI00131538DA|nr:FUSC family protein [Acidipila sp. EB88]